MSRPSLLSELRQRKVVQVAAIYGAVAWGVTEIVVTVVEQLFLPQWISTLAVIGFVVGFPVAMFLAWTFDITREGIQRTRASSRRGTASITISIALLIGGTFGLFLLIKPAIQEQAREQHPDILPNSIAVLPFDNTSGNPNDDYLSSGVSDELREQLGRVSGLRIAARSSSIAVQEIGGDAISSSRKLGVAHLVEGSLRRRGNVLSVLVEIVDGRSGLVIWTESYERGPGEILSLQQQLTENIVAQLMPGSNVALPEPPTRNATANESLLLGRYYEQQVRDSEEVDFQKLLTAIDYYRDAVEMDPESALAHSRLASALLYLGDIDAAEAPIFRALSLNPTLSAVQYTLGQFYWARGFGDAYTAFERAVELDPDNADALEAYAWARWIRGDNRGVADLYRRALEIDRHSLARYGALGIMLGYEGATNAVLELIDQIRQRFDGPDAWRMISHQLQLIGRIDAAIVWGIRARDFEPDNDDHNEWLAYLLADMGDPEAALAVDPTPGIGVLYLLRRYDELIDEAELLMIEEPEDIELRYLLAFAYTATEKYDLAIHVLGSTGMPDTILEDRPRRGADWHAFFTFINAANGFGDNDVARALAKWYFESRRVHHDNPEWTVEFMKACSLATLERDEEALEQLELMLRSPRLPTMPSVTDSFCLRRYTDNPRYLAVVEHFEKQRAGLRQRLPETLAAAGVSL
jgi:TolB-like protein/tetratricopeptide (TPR) repeat protein